MRISFVVSEDENLGVEYLAYYLEKNGHKVNLIFDPRQFDKAYTRNKFLAKVFSWQKINVEGLREQKPDLIAFSCATASYQWALNLAKIVKEEIKKPIIFGGTHPTLMPDLVMENKEIDMVCVGEGEEALIELANSFDENHLRTDIKNIWFRKDGEVIKNDTRVLGKDIDKYQMDRKLFFDKLPDNYRKDAYFITSRGCPFNCSFCGNEQKRKVYSGKGKYLRQKSITQAIAELKELKEIFKTKNILFVDDVLTMDRKWFFDFIKRYKEHISLPFTCFIHPKFFDKEIAVALKSAGCNLVWYGIQSGSEKVRREVLDRYETNEEIIRTAEICRELGLKYMVDHIFDIPFDSDITKSIDLYNAIRPHMLNCYNLLYFPKSKIIEYGLKANMLNEQDVNKINRGQAVVYQTGALSSHSQELRDNYSKYALLLTLIPVLPARLITRIRKSNRLMNLFSRLPLFLIPIVKVFLNFRVNHGFIPLAVAKTELFWVKKLIFIKFKRLLGRKNVYA